MCAYKCEKIKNRADFLQGSALLLTFVATKLKRKQIVGKGTHFFGQPILNQLLNYFNKQKILQISRKHGGERYVKTFDAWCHLAVMLYAVISRFDSLREITSATMMEWRKLAHLGIKDLPRRSTLSDANARRSHEIFGEIYKELYLTYKDRLSSDSPSGKVPKWMRKLQIIDSTTISLFSNLVFKGVGRNPKTGKKKGGIKVHTCIHGNEGVPCDVEFTSAATHDHFMLCPSKLNRGDLLAIDRAYIDYAKFEEMTRRGVFYVTKMKRNLTYEVLKSIFYMNRDGKMQWKEELVVFRKEVRSKNEETGEEKMTTIEHKARIITHVDEKMQGKAKIIRLLTNDLETEYEEIVTIYKARWAIELLFKQIKQNFPLRYFYGESANAIKIQVWVTLIANLIITLLQKGISRSWSFSGLATIVRIMLMYYININGFLEHPEKDWEEALAEVVEEPPEPIEDKN